MADLTPSQQLAKDAETIGEFAEVSGCIGISRDEASCQRAARLLRIVGAPVVWQVVEISNVAGVSPEKVRQVLRHVASLAVETPSSSVPGERNRE